MLTRWEAKLTPAALATATAHPTCGEQRAPGADHSRASPPSISPAPARPSPEGNEPFFCLVRTDEHHQQGADVWSAFALRLTG